MLITTCTLAWFIFQYYYNSDIRVLFTIGDTSYRTMTIVINDCGINCNYINATRNASNNNKSGKCIILYIYVMSNLHVLVYIHVAVMCIYM